MNDAVKQWIKTFRSNPHPTLNDLIKGRAMVPSWSHATLHEIFLEIYDSDSASLDAALTEWISKNLGAKPDAGIHPSVWASHLKDLFEGVAEIPLPEFEKFLREHVVGLENWLKPLRLSDNCNPLIAAYRVLAWGHTNQGMEESHWRPFALHPPHGARSYASIGLQGLIRARDAGGKLPSGPTELLLDTLLDLADSGMLYDAWKATTYSVMVGFQLTDARWAQLFQNRLAARVASRANGVNWIIEVVGKDVWEKTKAIQLPRPRPKRPITRADILTMIRSSKTIDEVAKALRWHVKQQSFAETQQTIRILGEKSKSWRKTPNNAWRFRQAMYILKREIWSATSVERGIVRREGFNRRSKYSGMPNKTKFPKSGKFKATASKS
jgi:hypothetical protein